MKLRTLLLTALASTALILASCQSNQSSSSSGHVKGESSAKAAPHFTLHDHTGKKVSLSDYKGKIVVLEWINWDCPYVKRHHQAGTMSDLYNKYKDHDVVWLGIDSTHYTNKQHCKKYCEKYNVPYHVLLDPSGKVGKMYHAKTTPHMYVIDKHGHIVYQGAIDNDPNGTMGDNTVNYVDKALKQLTQGQQVTHPMTKPYGCSVKYKN